MSISVRNPARPLPGILIGLLVFSSPALAQQTEGMFVSVPNPITSDVVKNIKAQVNPRIDKDNPHRATTVVFDFNPDGKPAASTDFGPCLDLQDYIQKLQLQAGVKTVAFVHSDVTAHTVLPVITCRELAMSKTARIGQITGEGVDPLDENKKRIYLAALPSDRQAAMAAVIRKMYDPDVKLMKGFSRGPANTLQYVDGRDDAAVKKLAGVEPVKDVPDGQIGLYSAPTARAMELCNATAETRADVAELYGLPPSSIRDDPLQGRRADVYRWVIPKEIDAGIRDSFGRVIRDVRRKGGNVLILVINVGGHDLVTARNLADDIRAVQTSEEPVKVIALITDTAPDAGTVVALGCAEIAMYRSKPDGNGEPKEAVIGDFEGYLKNASAADAEANRASIRALAELQGYPGILIDGMFNKDLEIVRASKTTSANRKVLMTREEFNVANAAARANAAGGNPDVWNQDKVIKPKGQLLKLNATLAAEVGLARTIVDKPDAKAVSAAYGWNDPNDPDPGWLDRFADFLKIPVVTVLLVVIGFTGLILELKMPGLTVPGIIAALCFIMVFWAQSRFSGQTFVLALLLFLMGLVLVGLEIFVLPGFGACGIFGILCMLAGLGLVTLDKIPQTGAEWGGLGVRVSQYMFAMMGALALAFTIARFLPKLPGANRLVLEVPIQIGATAGETLPGGVEAAELLGAIGTTSTPLRPAGVVKFGEKFVDVVSDGGFILAGTRVQVIQVEGTRIVVKEV